MCWGCLLRSFEDDEELPEPRPLQVLVARMIWDWYRLPGNDTGGPLHIVVDDNNTEDEFIDWCWESRNEFQPEHDSIERSALQIQISHWLKSMPDVERNFCIEAADAYGDTPPSAISVSNFYARLKRDWENRETA